MCSPESALEAAFTRYARGYLSFCTKQLLMIKYIWTPKSHPHFKAFIFIIPLFLHYCSLPVRVLYTCNFSWWAVSCALMPISKKKTTTLRQIDCNPSRPSAAGWMSVGWRAVGGMPPKLELGFFLVFFKKKRKSPDHPSASVFIQLFHLIPFSDLWPLAVFAPLPLQQLQRLKAQESAIRPVSCIITHTHRSLNNGLSHWYEARFLGIRATTFTNWSYPVFSILNRFLSVFLGRLVRASWWFSWSKIYLCCWLQSPD